MKMFQRMRLGGGVSILSGALGLALASCGSSGDGKPPLPSPDDFIGDIRNNQSCALNCDPACNETETPWKCPALADWNDIGFRDVFVYCIAFDQSFSFQ